MDAARGGDAEADAQVNVPTEDTWVAIRRQVRDASYKFLPAHRTVDVVVGKASSQERAEMINAFDSITMQFSGHMMYRWLVKQEEH